MRLAAAISVPTLLPVSVAPGRSSPFTRSVSLRQPSKLSRVIYTSASKQSELASANSKVFDAELVGDPNKTNLSEAEDLGIELGSPIVPFLSSPSKLSLTHQASFLLAFIACIISVCFTSLVLAAVPTLFAMRRAAISMSKLADTAREELPSTMAAIRLSGMEISDLTLELSDLSQEIADGVNKSAQAVQAAEAGIRQIGAIAHHHTVSMIQERANLPIISLQPVVAGAAKKTTRAVGQATKALISIISGVERSQVDTTAKEVGES